MLRQLARIVEHNGHTPGERPDEATHAGRLARPDAELPRRRAHSRQPIALSLHGAEDMPAISREDGGVPFHGPNIANIRPLGRPFGYRAAGEYRGAQEHTAPS